MIYNKFTVIAALAGETRFKIVTALIKHGPTSVEGIAEYLGTTHSAVSHQLKDLYGAGIVTCKKDSRHRIYQIAKSDAGKAAQRIMRI